MAIAEIEAYVALGANQGDPARHFERALETLALESGITVGRCSSLYASPPMGPQDQPDFINAVCQLHTTLDPHTLLAAFKRIESEAGRDLNARRWGPRPLDLDLLLYGQRRIESGSLKVPHVGIAERRFVLVPLAEIAAERRVPGLATVAELLTRCPDTSACTRIEQVEGWRSSA